MMRNRILFSFCLFVLWAVTINGQNKANSRLPTMLYAPNKGKGIWDPSIIFHNNKYYMYSMFRDDANQNNSVWLATSDNGVFWEDAGIVIKAEGFSNNTVWKMFVHRVGDVFVMNHGAFTEQSVNNNLLRFYTSKNLVDWSFSHQMTIDTNYYKPNTRWDHMYVIPKEINNKDEGYWGYVVACPQRYNGFGMMESRDGLHFTALPAPTIQSDFDVPNLELGGVEKIGDMYYLLGGVSGTFGFCGYGAYTLRSKSPTGPFIPDDKAYRLCGTSGIDNVWGVHFLPAWIKGTKDERLISNYATFDYLDKYKTTGKGVWLLPLREVVIDKEKHLRLGYWKQNDLAKGKKIPFSFDACEVVFPTNKDERSNTIEIEAKKEIFTLTSHKDVTNKIWTERFNDRRAVVVLNQTFDLTNGIIIEGKIKATVTGIERKFYSGFYIEEDDKKGTAIALNVGDKEWRKSLIGKLNATEIYDFEVLDETGSFSATVNGISPNTEHSFRLWICNGLFELYIDELLMQTYFYGSPTGRIGFMTQGTSLNVSDMHIYTMKHKL